MSKRIKAILLVLTLCFASIPFIPAEFAAALSTDLTKIGAQHFNSCYSKLPSSTKLSTAADFINYGTGDFSASGGEVPLPNTVMEGTDSASPTITCQQYFFGGNDSWQALINVEDPTYNSASSPDTQVDKTRAFLERLGYEAVMTKEKGVGNSTLTITYDNPSNKNNNSEKIVAVSNTLNIEVYDENGTSYVRGVSTTGSPSHSTGVSIEIVNGDEIRFTRGADAVFDSVFINDDTTYTDLILAINESMSNLPSDIKQYYSMDNSNISYSEKDIPINNDTVFQRKSMLNAMNNLLGIKSDYGLTTSEIYNIYMSYLSNGKYVEMSCGLTSDPGDGWMQVRVKRNGASDNSCYVRERQKTLYNGAAMSAGSTGYIFNQTNLTLADIVARVNAINPDDAKESQDVDPNGGNGGAYKPVDPDVPVAEEVDCYNSAGAGGWFVCWVIEFTQNTITAIYDSIISNFLEFRATFLEIRSDNAVYTAWQTFQSFANILFVIVLLIVIFSQLTGVGVDNLGIKRILPKLIIAAVLINLSYIICMLFVDISNILGSGLNSLFANITVTASQTGATGSAVLSTIMELAVTGAVGGLAVATVGIWGGVVVIPLLLGLITTLIGILFFFILLGARQAAIVILIVISPVALACYMLPNTKSFFDKWLKIFEAMLILYPLCGLLMGGSAFASDILMTLDQGFLGKLIAMLVGVVPFFFIPSLLRGAFTAMGNLGSRITGFGQNMGRRISGAVGSSDAVRDANARLRAGINADGSLNALGRYRQDGAFTNWAARSRIPGVHRLGTMAQESNRRANARAQAARIKYLDERAREDRLNAPGFFQQYQRSQEMALEKEQLNTAIDNINDTTQKGEDEAALFARYDRAVESGDVFEARAVAEIAGRRKDTANAFIEKFKRESAAGKYAGRENVMAKVAKQIATGDNSKNYRASNAMGFEYASQLVKGQTSENYGTWSNSAKNVKDAMEHHVTNGKELYGQSNASLRELAAKAGTDENKQYLADLARRGEFEGLNTGGEYDQTKRESFNTIKSLAPPSTLNVRERSSDTASAVQSNPALGNVSDSDLERLSQFYRNKVANGTATLEDQEMINTIDQAMGYRQNIRQNGQNGQGTQA